MKQEQILLKLVAATDSASWVNNMYGWTAPTSSEPVNVCDWSGIDCGDGAAVQTINLSSTNLATSIPPELGMLYELRKIDLSNNIIMGSIPEEVANLPHLEEFHLQNNQLTGALPAFRSTTLRQVDLENNNLEGKIPQNIGHNHPEMTYFGVCTNGMHGTLPASLAEMPKLETLCLSSNKFYGELPSEFGQLSLLQFLYVDNNDLMGVIPPELLPESSRLQELWLHHNHFSGTLPPALADMPELRDFYIDRCKFTGNVPKDMCKEPMNADFFEDDKERNVTEETTEEPARDFCQSIACPAETYSVEGIYPCVPCPEGTMNPYLARTAECFNNDEDQILQDFFSATGGRHKGKDNSSSKWNNWFMEGYEKCEFVGITCNEDKRVTRIELPSKGLVGTIPETLGFLEHLETLNLADNELTGFLPPDLGMAPLRHLDVTGNKMIGIVPPKLCMTQVNGNGFGGRYECDLIACPEGTYSNTGMANARECLPCNDGVDYLGKKFCTPGMTAASASSASDDNSSTGKTVGLVFGLMGVAALFVAGVMFYVVPRYKTMRMEAVSTSEVSQFTMEAHDTNPYTDRSDRGNRVMNIDEYNPNGDLDYDDDNDLDYDGNELNEPQHQDDGAEFLDMPLSGGKHEAASANQLPEMM